MGIVPYKKASTFAATFLDFIGLSRLVFLRHWLILRYIVRDTLLNLWILNAVKVDIPPADCVNFYVAVVKNSTEERLVDIYGIYAHKRCGRFAFIEHALFVNDFVVVELDNLFLPCNYVVNQNNQRNDKKKQNYAPKRKRRQNAFSCYIVRLHNTPPLSSLYLYE